MSFLVTLRKELQGQWRTYRILVLGVVLILFGLLSPLIAYYTPEIIKMIPEGETIAPIIPEPTIMDAVIQYTQNISQFGVILALLLAMGMITVEKNRGTAAMMLVKPLPRSTFLLAKFTVLALVFALALSIAGAACYYYTWVLFGSLDLIRWVVLNGFLLVFLLVYVALTLLCSVLMKSQAAAGGLAFGLLAALGLVGIIPSLGKYLPGQLVTWGIQMMAGIDDAYWGALVINVGIIVAALSSAVLIFQKQEI